MRFLLLFNSSNLSKIEFFHDTLVFYDQFRSIQTLLFYSKQKVWIFPEILSPFPALYDKISLLWLLAKSAKKCQFRTGFMHFDENVIFVRNVISSLTLRGPTEARFYRMELERSLKFQKRSILFVLNKIKLFVNFWIGRRIPNVSWKNWYFTVFDGFRVPMDGKVRPKNFYRAHVKVCISK